MKKQITLSIALLFATAILNAQTLNPTDRNKAALRVTKLSKQNMTTKMEAQGQDITQRMDNTITSVYDVTATNELGAKADVKIIAVKMEMEVMGQEMSYDSQNPEDGSPEMGTSAKELMKNTIAMTLDANALITTIKGNEKAEKMNSQAGGGLEKGEVLDVFFKVTKPINVNDTWEEKIDTKEAKTINKYTYKSFENGLANIEQVSTVSVNQKIEQMGMTMYSKLDGTIVVIYTVDAKTLLVKSKSSTTVLKGTMDAGGQSMPMSTFVQATETYQ